MHTHAFGDLRADDELEPRGASSADVIRRPGLEHDEPRSRERRTQLECLADGRDAERSRTLGERGASAVHRAVAVPVRLHDRPQLRTVGRADQPARVTTQRSEVDRDRRPHRAQGSERRGGRCRP